MRNRNDKKWRMLWFAVCAAICFTACGSHTDKAQSKQETAKAKVRTEKPQSTDFASSAQPMTSEAVTEANRTLLQSESPQTSLAGASHAHTVPVDKQAQYAAYKKILLNMAEKYQLLFDESQAVTDLLKTEYESGSVSNSFSVADVDGDGSDELLINAIGKIGDVFDYDMETGACYLQYRGCPSLSFYTNGTVEEGWSHNQGKAGRFWPYTLYVYEKETDQYKRAGYVDAYDKNLYENNQEALAKNPFPYAVDTDGNGLVYYIYENDQTDTETKEAVDDKAYQQWLNSYTGGSEKIQVEYHTATQEEILAFFQ